MYNWLTPMLEEVFIIIGFSVVYFDFNKNIKTNRMNKMAAPIESFFGTLN